MHLQYDLEYSRKLWKVISGYLKFSTGQKYKPHNSYDFEYLSEEDLKTYDQNFLTNDNDGDRSWLNPINSTSYGIGLKIRIIADGQSVLSSSIGALYYRASVVRTRGAGSQLASWRENYTQFVNVMPEFAIYYDYNITDNFFLGMKSSLAFDRFNIGLGVHGGVHF